jgi:hypothetical protein
MKDKLKFKIDKSGVEIELTENKPENKGNSNETNFTV